MANMRPKLGDAYSVSLPTAIVAYFRREMDLRNECRLMSPCVVDLGCRPRIPWKPIKSPRTVPKTCPGAAVGADISQANTALGHTGFRNLVLAGDLKHGRPRDDLSLSSSSRRWRGALGAVAQVGRRSQIKVNLGYGTEEDLPPTPTKSTFLRGLMSWIPWPSLKTPGQLWTCHLALYVQTNLPERHVVISTTTAAAECLPVS